MRIVIGNINRVLTFTFGLIIAVPAVALALTANPDQEVLGLIQAIDQHEIQAAQAAQQKQNIDPKVIDYAKMMEREHSKNLDKVKDVEQRADIQPADTPAVINQRTKGTEEMTRLNALDGAQFASAYISAMVSGHTDALSLIDSQADKIQNQDVKKQVMETRQHIEHHLKEAQQVQDELARPQ